MKQNNKKKKRALLRRRIRRIGYTLAVVICLICIALITYIFLLEEGIVKLDSKNQAESKVVTSQSNVQTMQVLSDKLPDAEKYQQEENMIVDTSDMVTTVSESVESTVGENIEDSIIVMGIGNIEPDYLDYLNTDVVRLPKELLSNFLSDGWSIYLSDENLSEEYFYGMYAGEEILGATSYEKKCIVIANCEKAVKYGDIFHEFGHWLDRILERPSLSPEFKEIFQEESPTFNENIGYSRNISTEQEFFAEMFRQYMYCPSNCTPKGYSFIEKQLNILKERSL